MNDDGKPMMSQYERLKEILARHKIRPTPTQHGRLMRLYDDENESQHDPNITDKDREGKEDKHDYR